MTENCRKYRKVKYPRLIQKLLRDNAGMTMAETLVAFALLIIISLSFLAILQFASRMTMEADDRRALAQELDEKLAHKSDEGFGLRKKMSVTLKSKDGTGDISLENCAVYSLNWPETDTAVTVLRFRYKKPAAVPAGD